MRKDAYLAACAAASAASFAPFRDARSEGEASTSICRFVSTLLLLEYREPTVVAIRAIRATETAVQNEAPMSRWFQTRCGFRCPS
jgi:hypothetical protein